MEDKGTYGEFVNRMLDEVDFLAAPKACEQLDKLLADCGLTGQPVEEVRKHTVSAIAKYERMILKELWKPKNFPKMSWNDAIHEVDKRRSGRLAREEADRSLKIRKLLREGVRPSNAKT
jgi:hypothetical protein